MGLPEPQVSGANPFQRRGARPNSAMCGICNTRVQDEAECLAGAPPDQGCGAVHRVLVAGQSAQQG